MEWHTIFDRVSPSVVKIETPSGHGTGFICHYSENQKLMAIATAKHVIEHADYWQQPVRIVSAKGSLLLEEADRVIIKADNQDSGMILTIKAPVLDPPENLIPLLPKRRSLRVGVEVGWIGFPAIGNPGMHFFSGKISAFNKKVGSYFIDGVAINGVSGGPVFCESVFKGTKELQIIGSIAAYVPNRASGEVFPGLSIAGDLTQLNEMVQEFKELRKAAQETDPPKVEEAQETDPKA